MRWFTLAVCCLGVFISAVSTVPTDGTPYVVVMPQGGQVVCNVGDKRVFVCKGGNLPQNLEWFSPSGELVEARSIKHTRVYVEPPQNKTLIKSSIFLFIQSASLKDTGKWICKAGEDLSSSIDILVGEKVNLTEREVELTGEENKSVRIDCVAKGHPAPMVQWYKDNTIIEEDPNKYIVRQKGNNHQLEIKNLNHMDPGDYLCKLTQESLSYYTDKLIHLSVKHKPFIINPTPSKYRVQEIFAILDETKNITCSAIGNPPPTFTWAKQNEDTKYEDSIGDDMVFTSEDGSYSVLMLRMYNESYLGQYKCSVHNSLGHEFILFHVTLGNKPSPPDNVVLSSNNATTLTFNVTCTDCNFELPAEDMSPDATNLTVTGYNFQLVPYREGFDIADWEVAEEFAVDVVEANDTLFTVGPLANGTTYFVRVASRNKAGLSDWLEIATKPSTTNAAPAITTIFVLIFTILCSVLY